MKFILGKEMDNQILQQYVHHNQLLNVEEHGQLLFVVLHFF